MEIDRYVTCSAELHMLYSRLPELPRNCSVMGECFHCLWLHCCHANTLSVWQNSGHVCERYLTWWWGGKYRSLVISPCRIKKKNVFISISNPKCSRYVLLLLWLVSDTFAAEDSHFSLRSYRTWSISFQKEFVISSFISLTHDYFLLLVYWLRFIFFYYNYILTYRSMPYEYALVCITKVCDTTLEISLYLILKDLVFSSNSYSFFFFGN